MGFSPATRVSAKDKPRSPESSPCNLCRSVLGPYGVFPADSRTYEVRGVMGRLTVKVLPSPRALLTETSPP